MQPTNSNYFYVFPRDIHGGAFILREEEYRHAVRVLRMKTGDIMVAVDGEGNEYLGEIKEISGKNKTVHCTVIKKRRMPNEPITDITLLQAVIKGDRQDYLVEKAVEIGVNRIVPVETARCIAKAGKQKILRWRRIALAAMKQSGRSVMTEITDPFPWDSAVRDIAGSAVKIALYMKGSESIYTTLDDIRSRRSMPASYCIAVGPEGDFTSDEIHLAQEYGFRSVTLGPRRLRSETAGLAAASILIFESP